MSLEKFYSKVDESIFLEYSLTSKIYKIFNKRSLVIEDSIHDAFDETNPFSLKKEDINNDACISKRAKKVSHNDTQREQAQNNGGNVEIKPPEVNESNLENMRSTQNVT